MFYVHLKTLNLLIMQAITHVMYIFSCRDRVKLYVEKYRDKTHSINPSSSLLTKIQVRHALVCR